MVGAVGRLALAADDHGLTPSMCSALPAVTFRPSTLQQGDGSTVSARDSIERVGRKG